MSALARFTRPVDGTIPVPALLYDDERLLASQEGVGLYDGPNKSPAHQSGTVHITSHRLFFIAGAVSSSPLHAPPPNVELGASVSLSLDTISHTESYTGFFKSSPKVTLHLRATAEEVGAETISESTFELWECEICGYRNPPGLSPAARNSCGLCGMPRSISSSGTPSSSTPKPTAPLSSSPSLISDGFRESERSQRQRRKPSAIACAVCTFLNHPYLRECEMCGTPLPTADRTTDPISDPASNHGSGALHVTSKSAPTSRPLSFRKGGDKAFYAALKTALQQKEWEVRWKSGGGSQSHLPSGLSGISKFICGILQNIDTTALRTERGMSDAFEDLEALMSKAQYMVRLAKGLNEQLTAASRNPNPNSNGVEPLEPEEATFVRSSLGQLGLNMKNTAVTADMSNDERKYLDQLAAELASVLEGGSDIGPRRQGEEQKVGIMKKRGIIGLDEVWGGWNRARGVALISPEVMLKTLPFLPHYTTPPITTRILSSGLRVLHTPAYSIPAFSTRLVAQLVTSGPRTTSRIAEDEALSVGLVEELVSEVEEKGDICREDPLTVMAVDAESGDGGGGGMSVGIEVKWWPNVFVGYAWDGQEE
ncbi:uncharacterized protein FOMMEDRAFT_105283 [Fomitiporia mediterranea MF3/22]|uniref:uncharacterized protein n=1 Tax=Fomitiporia mediterranea (strain MF3/22) TaxID=694068 RepID=UPI0004407BF0|nr:uncharacterized protein FOMMEDRAFT_105283 [Fomitiporia mediterranea MF3/22]EJD05043.1 hypothetical protein FOMMEDRAFT_105283 [Fomitiporia mediterranea MF3/22]